MAAGTYVGVNGVARKVKAQYVGVNGTARKVTKGYAGINGTARKVWEADAGGSGSSFACNLIVNFSGRYGDSLPASCELSFSKSDSEYVSQAAFLNSPPDAANVDSAYSAGVPSDVANQFVYLVLTASGGSTLALMNNGAGTFSTSEGLGFFPLQGNGVLFTAKLTNSLSSGGPV